MSAAAAATTDAPAPKKGKKKLVILLAVVLLLVAAGGGAAFFLLKKKAPAEGEEEDAGTEHVEQATKHDPKHLPTFMPLDPFTVNLADREAERYLQVGVTLEVADPHDVDQIKAYMPAIRNNVLMLLSHKTSQQLMERAGKERLAAEIRRESVRPLGVEIELDDAEDAAPDPAHDEETPKKKKKKKKSQQAVPVTSVQFSNFIIQ